jgi:hypothetical protein
METPERFKDIFVQYFSILAAILDGGTNGIRPWSLSC